MLYSLNISRRLEQISTVEKGLKTSLKKFKILVQRPVKHCNFFTTAQVPSFAMDLAYGSEVAVLVNKGAAVEPKRLKELGYEFKERIAV